MNKITYCFAIYLGMSACLYGQTNNEHCGITAKWWDPGRGTGSRVHVLDLFEASETDNTVVRSVKDENRNLFVIAGISYQRSHDIKGDPLFITLAIRTSNQDSKDLFHYAENASESVFLSAERKWMRFSVSTHVKEQERIIKYTMTCENSNAVIRLTKQR